MKHRYASDCHSHSDCSFDGEASMEAMCRRAEELGLSYYAVTDHCECNGYSPKKEGDFDFRRGAARSWEEMARVREGHPGLRFLRGIELGQPMQDLSAAQDVLSGRDYDLVIGSLHNLKDEEDFYYMAGSGMDGPRRKELFSRYFSELLEMIRWGRFDTLAHITYPLRYLFPPGSAPSFDGHREELSAVLAALAQGGKALEFNTSRLGKAGCPVLPDLELFTLFKKQGGKYVTIGSDAHRPEDLGHGIDEAMELLRQAGFREFTVFVNRKPVMLPLE